jgi:hypothetical protein
MDLTAERKVAVFNHVKKSVKWNGYYGYSCNDGVKRIKINPEMLPKSI